MNGSLTERDVHDYVGHLLDTIVSPLTSESSRGFAAVDPDPEDHHRRSSQKVYQQQQQCDVDQQEEVGPRPSTRNHRIPYWKRAITPQGNPTPRPASRLGTPASRSSASQGALRKRPATSTSTATTMPGRLQSQSPSPSEPRPVRNMLLQMDEYDFFDVDRSTREQQLELQQQREQLQSLVVLSADHLPTVFEPTVNPKSAYGIGTFGLGERRAKRAAVTRQRDTILNWKSAKDHVQRVKSASAGASSQKRQPTFYEQSAAARVEIIRKRVKLLDDIKEARKRDDDELKALQQRRKADEERWAAHLRRERDESTKLKDDVAIAQAEHMAMVKSMNRQEFMLHRITVQERQRLEELEQKSITTKQQSFNSEQRNWLHEQQSERLEAKRQLSKQQRERIAQSLDESYEQREREIEEKAAFSGELRARLYQGVLRAKDREYRAKVNACKAAKKVIKTQEELCKTRKEEEHEVAALKAKAIRDLSPIRRRKRQHGLDDGENWEESSLFDGF